MLHYLLIIFAFAILNYEDVTAQEELKSLEGWFYVDSSGSVYTLSEAAKKPPSFFATSCIQIDKAPLGEGKMIEIRHGTTGNFNGLRIGLGNINKSDYTNDLGEKKHGLVAMLWLYINGNPPQEKQFEVYAGRNIKMDKYLIYVQEIRGGLKGSVKLQVKKEQ